MAGIKGLEKAGCIVCAQLEGSSYGLCSREWKTLFLVPCTPQSRAALIERFWCTFQRSQSFFPKPLWGISGDFNAHDLTPEGCAANTFSCTQAQRGKFTWGGNPSIEKGFFPLSFIHAGSVRACASRGWRSLWERALSCLLPPGTGGSPGAELISCRV